MTDTGIGIPDDKIAGLFSPFTQVDGSTARKYGGTGLGLAICKQLAAKMGGRIGIESEEGKGSRFWFEAVFVEQSIQAADAANSPDGFRDLRILVVDDQQSNRLAVTTLLGGWGCRVTEALAPREALDALIQAAALGDPFQVALLAGDLPGQDGFELGRTIRAQSSLQTTKLVAMTTLGQRAAATQARELGFSGQLTKPIRRKQLLDCVARVLNPDLPAKNAAESSPGLRGALAAANGRILRVLIAEDNPINQEVALTILKKNGIRAEAVGNGLEAVKALQDMPYDLVLMDVQMPEMDGLEATRLIRDEGSRVCNPRVPVIAMTANVMKSDQDECRAAGMDDFLSKPIQPIELIDKIAYWVSALQGGEMVTASECCFGAVSLGDEPPDGAAGPAAEDRPAVEAVVPIIHFQQLCARVLDDRDAALELLEKAVERLQDDSKTVRRSIEAGDLDEVRRLGHKLRGTAGNLSAQPLATACEQLELAAKAGDAAALAELQREFSLAAEDFRVAVRTLSDSETSRA